MKPTQRNRRDTPPMMMIRHLDQQGLGRGHDLYPDRFWVKGNTQKKGR